MRTLLFFLFSLCAFAAPEDFLVPERIKNDVDFWKRVYAEWDTHQVVFYDSSTKYVYDILNLPKVENELSSRKFRNIVEHRYNDILSALKDTTKLDKNSKKDPLTLRVHGVLKQHGLTKEKDLGLRLRNQNGLRGQFEDGLKISGRYADEMKAVLRSQKLPEDLLAIVFVESLFSLRALSHRGAKGPWGFVKETAINCGIHVNKFTDEREDPVKATRAAARYLGKAIAGLEDWGLAVTSYNYGYAGMKRAVNNLGTRDFSVILDNHESPIFGYASKNYYAEFLAAREILMNQKTYFPGVQKDPKWRYETVKLTRPIESTDLFAFGAITPDALTSFNPSLTKHTIQGQEVIPGQYVLRIPWGKSKSFYDRVKKVPSHRRNAAAEKVSSKFVANGKRSLLGIAKSLGISGEFLAKRLGKPLNYQPKGMVIIRSQYHLFSLDQELLDFTKIQR